ncbi:uncharacterized protein YjbI with pentapeptide repeats [Skermanella aerolata]|uniref:pentapeptide repeat-containing protein n=1 Tax=Skermanella aerolata TaxID=393310 RepID=UPI003D205377
MADEDHLKRLNEIETWNQWRESDGDVVPDLSEADLSKTLIGRADLNNADLTGANLSGANLVGARLAKAKLDSANLKEAWLDEADLRGAKLSGANLSKADLFRTDLREKAELFGANLSGANLAEAKLLEADLSAANLREANLSRTKLHKAYLSGATLSEAKLYQTDLSEADLSNADLSGADLSDADLSGADLTNANLSGVNFRGAKLCRAKLIKAQVENASMAFVNLENAFYAPASPPPNSYLEGISNLETITFVEGQSSGIVLLRKLLQEAGLRTEERQATCAIERNMTKHLIFASYPKPENQAGDFHRFFQALRWREPLKMAHGFFRWLFFDSTVAYGLRPNRAIKLLIISFIVFAVIYSFFLALDMGLIYRFLPEKRIVMASGQLVVEQNAGVEQVNPSGFFGIIGRSLQFSLVSTFNIGLNWLDIGNWIARMQFSEYNMRAIDWARMLSGVQSLISIYLLAIWALSYFGRPFG